MKKLKIERECHYGNIHVATDKKSKVKIFGAGFSRGFEIVPNSLIISLLGHVDMDVKFFGNFKSPKKQEWFTKNCLHILIDWQDMRPCFFTKEDWIRLIDIIREEKRDTYIYCFGGHGRTGTTLSILVSLMDITKDNPVEFVRKVYCKKAVETEEQISYIRMITGHPLLDVKPSKDETILRHFVGLGGRYNGIFEKF